MKLQASRSKRRDGAPIRAHVTARIVPAGASPHDREIDMSDDRSPRDRRGRFAPERQRRFDRAFGEIERLCRGRFRRRSDWLDAPFAEPSPDEAERIRWLLVAMARARGTAGGEVIARLALRGYAISTRLSLPGPHLEILPLGRPGFVHLGHILPSSRRPWKRVEQAALGIDPEAYPSRRFCTAHESLAIRAALEREGHVLD